MSAFDTVLIILSCVFFFLAGIAPHFPGNPQPAVNWIAWGLFCFALAALPFF